MTHFTRYGLSYNLPMQNYICIIVLFCGACDVICIGKIINRVFSHDVTAAILVSQNNKTAAMLGSQTNP